MLGHGVHLVGEVAGARRPGPGEGLVGHPSDEQRLGLDDLVELVLELFGAGELEHPAAVRMAGLAARGFHDTVQGQEL